MKSGLVEGEGGEQGVPFKNCILNYYWQSYGFFFLQISANLHRNEEFDFYEWQESPGGKGAPNHKILS